MCCFLFKQKTAYEMRISDWSSDVCSSDLRRREDRRGGGRMTALPHTSSVHKPLPHDSAAKHVAGTARYIDDLPEPEGLLHAALHLADRAHAKILKIDTTKARAMAGVRAVIMATDVTGNPDIPAVVGPAPALEKDNIDFHGPPVVSVQTGLTSVSEAAVPSGLFSAVAVT